MDQWQIGEVAITRIIESEDLWDPTHFVAMATPEVVLAHDWVVGPFADADTGKIRLSINSFGLKVGDEKIIIDTCGGNDKVRPGSPKLHRQQTDYLERLTAAGFPPEEVTTVLCTHLHVDHVGWNTVLDGDQWRPTFPNARYLFGDTEWQHWRTEPQIYGDVVGDSVHPIIDAGQAELIPSDKIINDLVRLEPTPGHTPGHHSVRISSDGDDAVITGDIFHAAVQIEHPDWPSNPDVDPVRAAATRLSFLQRYCDDHTLVLATHLGGPGCGHLHRQGDGWRLDPPDHVVHVNEPPS
jgi:glyoxylase-like metal-dependent hydrolase (beta-lactamase superfamily II)